MIHEDEMKDEDDEAPRKENFMKALKCKPLNLTIYNLCYQVFLIRIYYLFSINYFKIIYLKFFN